MPPLPDRRVMEGMMRQLVGGLQGMPANPALQQAQDLIYEAVGLADESEKVRLAQQALALCPDCADAYVLLAEHAKSRKEARELYEKGVVAGERALGPQAFQESVGHFWGILETRPYMRAREGLAHCLWASGHREEAVPHLQEMLRLNPNDNQGARYTLASWLLILGRDEDLSRLLQQYPEEGMASWAYTKALLAFRQNGDTPETRQILEKARKSNRHVPAFLWNRKHLPAQQPDFYTPGQENEAIIYVASALAAWKATPGALDWLRAVEKSHRKTADVPQPKGPLGFIKDWLRRKLPQSYDVWQADYRQTPNWIVIAGEKVRPWLLLVASRSNDLVLAHDLIEETPFAARVWDKLVESMQYPAAGEPHRPTELQVRNNELWQTLKPHFEEIGVAVVLTDDLDQMNTLFDELGERIAGNPLLGLLDMPGIHPEQVAGFYEAAAHFHRQAPWQFLGYEDILKVSCAKYESGPWYAVVMGQSGMTFGLALYDDLHVLLKMLRDEANDEENARQTVALSATFGDETDLPVRDLDAAREHGWVVDGPGAYPTIFRKERGLTMRQPLAWELELMEGCLRAVPEFVAKHPADQPATEEMTVPVASGELRLTLSWVLDNQG
jgi:hypothetical protein